MHSTRSELLITKDWAEAARKNPGSAVKRFKYLGVEYH